MSDNNTTSKKTPTKISPTKKIVGTAIMSALAFGISFLQFPIFPATSFLKMDFSQVIILLTGFTYGPIFGAVACIIKESLCLATTQSAFVGELANVVITLGFILVPTIVYHYKKGLKTVIITLIIGCLIQTALALLMNRYVLFPMYGLNAEVFYQLWYYILFFNLIKTVVNSTITVLLYKRLKFIFAKI